MTTTTLSAARMLRELARRLSPPERAAIKTAVARAALPAGRRVPVSRRPTRDGRGLLSTGTVAGRRRWYGGRGRMTQARAMSGGSVSTVDTTRLRALAEAATRDRGTGTATHG